MSKPFTIQDAVLCVESDEERERREQLERERREESFVLDLLANEPTPPDEVKPRPLPFIPRLSISVMLPPGCKAWRVSVLVHLDSREPPACLEASSPSSIDAWNEAFVFVERATGQVLR